MYLYIYIYILSVTRLSLMCCSVSVCLPHTNGKRVFFFFLPINLCLCGDHYYHLVFFL